MGWALTGFASLYRGMWWSVAGLAIALGVVGSCVVLGTAGVFLVGGFAAGLAVLGGLRLRLPGSKGNPYLTTAALGLLCGVVALAVVGLVYELGPAGGIVAAVVAVAGWPALRWAPARPARRARGFRRGRARSAPAARAKAPAAEPPRRDDRRLILFEVPAMELLPPDPTPPLSALPSLSTAELCWAWRVSFVRLARATCGSQREGLAQLRRGYLDELERRDPVAFGRWFPTARAASDPARFFCPAQDAVRGQRNESSRGSHRSGAAG